MDKKLYYKAWREANKEKVREYQQQYQEANKDRLAQQKRAYYLVNREVLLGGVKARYKKDPDAARRRAAEWAKKNPERRSEISSKYSKQNLEKSRVNWRNRHARILGNGGRHTKQDVADLFQRQAGFCAHCRQDISGKFEVDHVFPLRLGGSNGPENLQLLCMPCNRRKGAKHPKEIAA